MEYKPSTHYLKADQTLANPKLPMIVDTVSKVSVNDGLGLTSTTDYFYEEGHFHFEDGNNKTFAGFGIVTKTDALGFKTKTYYHQGEMSVNHSALGEFEDHISKRGQAYRVEQYDQNNQLKAKFISRFEHQILAPDHIFAFLSQTISQTFDQGASTAQAQSFTYDQWGNQIEQIDYGKVTANGEGGSFTDTGNDLLKTLVSFIDQTGYAFETETFNQQNKSLSHQRQFYDNLPLGQVDKGNLTAEETWLNTSNEWVRLETNHDAYGLPISQKNPKGFLTYLEYDSHKLTPAQVTDPQGFKTYFHYDPAIKEAVWQKDPNGLIVQTFHDGLGRPTEVYRNGTLISSMSYDDLSMPRSVLSQNYNDDGKIVDQYVYLDGLDRQVELKQEAAGNKWSTTQTIYDKRGDIKKQIQPYFSTTKNFEALDANKIGTEMSYDTLHRPLTLKTTLGTTSTGYQGYQTTVTDPLGHQKTIQNDGRQNLILVEEKNGNETYQTHYNYDELGRLLKITDAQNNVRSFAYDSLGQRTFMSRLNAGDGWIYQYDLNGNLIQKMDPKGQVTHFEYDALDRLILEDGGTPDTVMNYAYDKGDFALGRLSRIEGQAYQRDFNYDIFGRLVADYKAIGGQNFSFRYAYDQLDGLKSMMYPDEDEVEYTYNNAHQLQTVKGSGGEIYAYNLQYNPLEQLISMSMGGQATIETNYTYNPAKMYQLESLSSNIKGQPSFRQYSYQFDALGNLTQLIDTNAGKTTKTVNYSYDDLSRLTQADYSNLAEGEPFSETYSYDALGNMLSKWDVGDYTYGLSQHPHAVTQAGDKLFDYDANGNMILRDDEMLTYDSQDRLTQVGDKVSFTYGEGTERVMKKDIQTQEIIYYADKTFERHPDKEVKYIYAGDKRVAKVEKNLETQIKKTYYLLTDHLDSIDTVLDEKGNIVERSDYFAFGEERVTESLEGAPETAYGYTGKELDTETGLNYYGARYYDSELGRFISVDPWEGDLSDPQSLNKYSYVRNNPLKYVDPTGEWFEKFTKKLRTVSNYLKLASSFVKQIVSGPSITSFTMDTIASNLDTIADVTDPNTSLQKKAVAVAFLAMDADTGGRASAVKEGLVPAVKGIRKLIAKNLSKADEAFYIAKNGGRHGGTYTNYINRSTEEIQKGIQSFQKQINQHKKKIADPSSHALNWEGMNNLQKNGLRKHWQDEINGFRDQKNILEGIIKERGL